MKRLGMKTRPLVVCGPSGVGKGTLLGLALREFPERLQTTVSYTTRKPRTGEEHGKNYYFTNKTDMLKDIEDGKFVEHANVHGNLYGTSFGEINRISESGAVCVLELDIQGAEAIRKTSINPNFCFILPPSFGHLESRLRGRGSETEETLKRRLETAEREMEYFDKCSYEHFKIINDDLPKAYEDLRLELLQLYPSLSKPIRSDL